MSIYRKPPPDKRGIPGSVNKYPAILYPYPAGQMVSNREIRCQPAEIRGVEEIRIIPEERECCIHHFIIQLAEHLRKKVMFGCTISLPASEYLFRRFQWIRHRNSEGIRDIPDMFKYRDDALFSVQTIRPFPEFLINQQGQWRPPADLPETVLIVRIIQCSGTTLIIRVKTSNSPAGGKY